MTQKKIQSTRTTQLIVRQTCKQVTTVLYAHDIHMKVCRGQKKVHVYLNKRSSIQAIGLQVLLTLLPKYLLILVPFLFSSCLCLTFYYSLVSRTGFSAPVPPIPPPLMWQAFQTYFSQKQIYFPEHTRSGCTYHTPITQFQAFLQFSILHLLNTIHIYILYVLCPKCLAKHLAFDGTQ